MTSLVAIATSSQPVASAAATARTARMAPSVASWPEAETREPALVDAFCAFAGDALPLLEWGWDALVDSR